MLAAALMACAPAGPSSDGGQGARRAGAEEPRKTITIAQPRAREGFGPWFMRGSGRILQWEELHSDFLVSTNPEGGLEGRLAARLPSLDDGSLVVLPDGRMRSTWKLHPEVKWQDGTPFTTADVLFGWEVATHPEIPVERSPTTQSIESITATDPHTLHIDYKSTYYKALELGFRDMYPLPRHLLGTSFEGSKDAFMQQAYFSTDYVHTGPFRVSEFQPGERVVMQRFDDYFRGRPKLHSIVLVFIGENSAVVANMLAGTVDMTGELPDATAARLRDEWKVSGNGFAVSSQGNWRFISLQFHPEWGRPIELRADRRAREGLLWGIDRQAIRDAVVPGYANTSGDSFMVKGDPRAAVAGAPFARFGYDPSRAAQLLAESGWVRGPDGRVVDARGQRVEIDIRTTDSYEVELSAVANDWRKLGLDVSQEIMTRALSQDREYIARFPSTEITAQSYSDGIFRRFDSRSQPLPQNRFVGSNGGHYVNPEMDRLIDRLYATVDERGQGQVLRDLGELLAEGLPALPMYFSVNAAVALKRVKALQDFPGATRVGTTARNAHLWDVD